MGRPRNTLALKPVQCEVRTDGAQRMLDPGSFPCSNFLITENGGATRSRGHVTAPVLWDGVHTPPMPYRLLNLAEFYG